MFVLGRHFAHFSGGEPDDRAAWGLWPQVLRLFEPAVSGEVRSVEGQDASRKAVLANPIRWLADELRKDAPSKRLPDGQLDEQRAELGEVRLVIRAAQPGETDEA